MPACGLFTGGRQKSESNAVRSLVACLVARASSELARTSVISPTRGRQRAAQLQKDLLDRHGARGDSSRAADMENASDLLIC